MPHGTLPPADPRIATVNTRCQALRAELERTDDAVDLLDRDDRVTVARHTTRIRAEIDGLESLLHEMVAGIR